MKPELSEFTPAERRIIETYKTPLQVQRYLRALPYNYGKGADTLRSFRQVVRHGKAHCLEAALAAAVILEQHGYPPLVISFESIDALDHVIFVYQSSKGMWGSVGRSRDEALHGRKPVFRSARALALSYYDPYIDLTGRITAYAVINLEDLGDYDWRFSPRNIWKLERYLIDYEHHPIVSSDRRYEQLRNRFRKFREEHPSAQPDYFPNQHNWT